MAEFLAFMQPYWTTIGVFIIAYAGLGYFEELIGLRGIVKLICAIVIAVLFFHFWDDVAMKFEQYLRFMGLEPPKEGMFQL